uniref:Uncharacterized protein n=1 Tax=Siphoviridae sp. ctj0M16 TaxID=2827918 RepID=A0A8S5S775_9CAUD|nr:MAG TPA: hypothetical protein [Siphoviridae sp. ctj0M16]
MCRAYIRLLLKKARHKAEPSCAIWTSPDQVR